MRKPAQILSLSALEEILYKIQSVKVGVIGDMALDAYWYADLTKSLLSRETPRFPRPVMREEYAPGAGANVAQNLAAIDVGKITVYSVFGNDWRGNLLIQELQKRGICTERVISSDMRTTSTYIKPILMGYESQQEDSRIDFENLNYLTAEIEDQLMQIIKNDISDLDGLYIADQFEHNGIITDKIRNFLNQIAKEFPQKIFMVDSRKQIGEYKNIILKPNWVEATRVVYPGKDPRDWHFEELSSIGAYLSQRTSRPVYITISDKGVLVCDVDEQSHIPSAPVTPPLDPVGAGDSFGSAVLAALSAGARNEEAGLLGCLAAGVTVEKLNQTGTASPDEIKQKFLQL